MVKYAVLSEIIDGDVNTAVINCFQKQIDLWSSKKGNINLMEKPIMDVQIFDSNKIGLSIGFSINEVG